MRTVTRLLIVLLAGVGALAVPSVANAATCVTPQALTTFFDAQVGGRLAENGVPGAVVTVVQGGQTVFSRGYGEASPGTPFDPDRSMLRIASISKLFTWVAVLQQVQAGRIDLDTDVNTYLKAFQIPATYSRPITVRDLMNHTAGFEDRIIGYGAKNAADVPPLATALVNLMPRRIRPPGEVTAYSNYGAALAGYIVSVVSGEPYDQYVQRHILDPLGMAHSTATEPVPAALAGNLAHSYVTDEKPVRTVPFTFDVTTPDGSVTATASDMMRFANAYLSGTLVPAAYTGRSYATDPRLGGYAYGFEDRMFDGHRVLMHDGSWEAFGTILAMVPDCGLAVFMGANSLGFESLLAPVLSGFFHLLPAGSATAPVPAQLAALHPSVPVAGFYKPMRHNVSTMEKVLTLLGPYRLTIASNGDVHFRGRDYIPGANGLYTATDGADHLVFLASSAGTHVVGTDGPALELMPLWESPIFNLVVLAVFALIALTAPIAFFRRRSRPRPARPWRWARWSTALAAVVGLAFIVLVMVSLFGDVRDYLFSIPLRFRLILLMPFLFGALFLGGAAGTVVGWRGAGGPARVHQTALLAGLAALTWFALQWNLVGW